MKKRKKEVHTVYRRLYRRWIHLTLSQSALVRCVDREKGKHDRAPGSIPVIGLLLRMVHGEEKEVNTVHRRLHRRCVHLALSQDGSARWVDRETGSGTIRVKHQFLPSGCCCGWLVEKRRKEGRRARASKGLSKCL